VSGLPGVRSVAVPPRNTASRIIQSGKSVGEDTGVRRLGVHESKTVLSVASAPPCVTILMCTRNGARFLEHQLNSIVSQSYPHWRLIASDDGSTDVTLALLRAFSERQENTERVEIRKGPELGATANFLSLVTDRRIDGDYFAYCDQDDVWFADKLERALAWLGATGEVLPALYCSRTVLTNAEGKPLGLSPRFRKTPSFRNALVQNIGGGNTMVFNKRARELLLAALPADVVSCDWWTYMLVSGAGGRVHYDEEPAVAYRQHSANAIGANKGFAAGLRRLKMLLLGEWVSWNDRNAAALKMNSFLLSPENQEVLEAFSKLRKGTLEQRLHAWRWMGVYRQTALGQFTLLLATIFRRL
jgi:glycosyltransferase involved in cell wall biosynthesis